MSLSVLVWLCFVVAIIPACLFLFNLFLYRAPLRAKTGDVFAVSILIPARNEERTIEASVRAALSSRHVDVEVLVLDDHSDDGTAEIVRRIALDDSRVRLIAAPPLPPGWCGKQHACHVLSKLASKETFCFIDADVRLSETGIARMIREMRSRSSVLISGFPRQDTRTFLEQILIPLMHFLLLGYLPMIGLRKSLHRHTARAVARFSLPKRKRIAGREATLRFALRGMMASHFPRRSGVPG